MAKPRPSFTINKHFKHNPLSNLMISYNFESISVTIDNSLHNSQDKLFANLLLAYSIQLELIYEGRVQGKLSHHIEGHWNHWRWVVMVGKGRVGQVA